MTNLHKTSKIHNLHQVCCASEILGMQHASFPDFISDKFLLFQMLTTLIQVWLYFCKMLSYFSGETFSLNDQEAIGWFSI